MKSEHKENWKSLTNVEEGLNKENLIGELMERDAISGTPFWIIGNKIDGYFLAFGRHRLGGVKDTKEEILKYLEYESWNIIGYLVGIICELTIDDKVKNGELNDGNIGPVKAPDLEIQ